MRYNDHRLSFKHFHFGADSYNLDKRCGSWLVMCERVCVCSVRWMAKMRSCFLQAVGGGICQSKWKGLGAENGWRWQGLVSCLRPCPPPPAGGYLIRGWKVGGNWGVRGVRLGTQGPSIHLEGKRRWHHNKALAVKVYGVGKDDADNTCVCMCMCEIVSAREWGMRLTHFLTWLNHLLWLNFYWSSSTLIYVELPVW